MKAISDKLSAIATTLDLEYIREMSLSDSNVDVHYNKTVKDLMMYIGPSDIATQFIGAQQVDVMTASVYFLTKKPKLDQTGAQVDDLLEITKRYADKTYYQLQDVDDTAVDIQPYTLEAQEILNDGYVGHMMNIGIPVNNDGC
jgi:hypothetical protein